MNIYVVFGQTGEYGDYTTWQVKAFRDEGKAKEHCVFANSKSRDIYRQSDGWDSLYKVKKQLENKEIVNEYDPKMQLDYTGTTYYYTITELE